MVKSVHSSLLGGDQTDDSHAQNAARIDDLDKLRDLIDNKKVVKVDVLDNSGRTLTMLAAYWGNLEVLKYLVGEKGAKCDNSDNIGMTCAMHAVANGLNTNSLEVLMYLVDEAKVATCDDSIQDNRGMTCFMHAAKSGKLDVLMYLVEDKKAEVNDNIIKLADDTVKGYLKSLLPRRRSCEVCNT